MTDKKETEEKEDYGTVGVERRVMADVEILARMDKKVGDSLKELRGLLKAASEKLGHLEIEYISIRNEIYHIKKQA